MRQVQSAKRKAQNAKRPAPKYKDINMLLLSLPTSLLIDDYRKRIRIRIGKEKDKQVCLLVSLYTSLSLLRHITICLSVSYLSIFFCICPYLSHFMYLSLLKVVSQKVKVEYSRVIVSENVKELKQRLKSKAKVKE